MHLPHQAGLSKIILWSVRSARLRRTAIHVRLPGKVNPKDIIILTKSKRGKHFREREQFQKAYVSGD